MNIDEINRLLRISEIDPHLIKERLLLIDLLSVTYFALNAVTFLIVTPDTSTGSILMTGFK